MFGDHFYHQRIRKAVAVFGSLFNDIKIVRKDASGNTLSQQKVPLAYAPKRDFLARIDAMANGEDAERQIALKLPRISFEILAMNYDPQRQMPKTNNCIQFPTNYDGTASRLYTPVPYIVSFQLNAYAKTQDDALQIVEQILPYFTPNYTLTIKPLNDFDIKEDVPITLTGVTFSDDYEAPLENRRSIIYTLDFDMKISLYKGVQAGSSIVEEACVQFADLDNPDELFSKVCTDSAFSMTTNLTPTIFEGAEGDYTFSLTQLPSVPSSFAISEPLHGTTSITLGGTLTSSDGIISATGSWQYVPDLDYSGLDSFNIEVLGDFGKRHFPVAMNVTAVEDAIDDAANCTAGGGFVDVTVSSNDEWESPVVYSIAIDGEPSSGTAVVTDSTNGIIRYTSDAGSVAGEIITFVYRATPSGGTSEVGTVTITIV